MFKALLPSAWQEQRQQNNHTHNTRYTIPLNLGFDVQWTYALNIASNSSQNTQYYVCP